MKKPVIIALCIATVLALAPAAHAGKKERAVIGGFIGGLIVGHALTKHQLSHPVHETVVVYDHPRHDRGGYWQENRVRVWVPGHWAVRIDRCGTRVRYYVSGRYEWRAERVWVAYTQPSRYERHPGRIVYGR